MANLNKMRKKKKRAKNLDEVHYGFEPQINVLSGSQDPQLTSALNWYNYMYDYKKGKAWLLQWMKANTYDKSKIAIVKNSPDWAVSTTACWVSRLANNGTKLAQGNIDFVDGRISQIIDKYGKVKDETAPKPRAVNIQARIAAKNQNIMDDAETIVDNWDQAGSSDMYEHLQGHDASPAVANKMLAYYKAIAAELNSDDLQIKEAHGKSLKTHQKTYDQVCADIERYVNNKKICKARKPRTVKIKPPSKLVEKVKYQMDDKELKLASANPEQIIGAEQVWLYNTKYQTASVFTTSHREGLSVKGTTIINYDKELATTKKLRKPEEMTLEILKAGKVSLRKFMDKLTTKPSAANGRINTNTIILRVIA